ncbi:hypothetical protein HYR99_39265 [Candidatus Poribacteria bacterium]|nr:hypothetical protein [Candidatus Poribacteria bacterium]
MEGEEMVGWLGSWVVGEEVDSRQWTVDSSPSTADCLLFFRTTEPPNHLTTHSRFTFYVSRILFGTTF